MSETFIWAHRGASAVAPENTVEAFYEALKAGADGIELDVHLSKDQIPVVIHDDSIDRTTDGVGKVKDLTFRELQQFDAGGWFDPRYRSAKIPSLAEVLEAFCGKLRINIEVKDGLAAKHVGEMVFRHQECDAVVSSFDRSLLHRLRRLFPNLPLALLIDRPDWHRAVSAALQLKACAIHPNIRLLNRPLLKLCDRHGLPVYTWTIDDPRRASRLTKIGVDGFFSNDPRRMVGLRS